MSITRRRARRPLVVLVAGALAVGGMGGAGLVLGVADAGAAPPPLALSGTAPATLTVGQGAAYTLSATAGASALSGISITATLPPDLTYVSSATVAPATWAPCVPAAQVVTCNLTGSLIGGSIASVQLNVTVKSTTVAPTTETVTVNGQGTDSSSTVQSATLAPPLTSAVPATADLALVKTIIATTGSPVTQITYADTVTNLGPAPELASAASPITLTDAVPPDLNFISATGPGWSCVNSGAPAKVITCVLATSLAAAATSTVTIKVGVPAGAPPRITTPAIVSGPSVDPNLANNRANAPQTLIPSGIAADSGVCSGAVAYQRTCNLLAASGTVNVPTIGAIPIWGFTKDLGPNEDPPGTAPGPPLVAFEGDTLYLNVRNQLPTFANSVGSLAAAMTASDTTFTANLISPPKLTTPFVMRIGTEQLQITGLAHASGTTYSFTVAPTGRGFNTTVATTHAAGAGVAVFDANNLAVAVPAVASTTSDEIGAPSGATAHYAIAGTCKSLDGTHTGLCPGTYLYQAGPTADGSRQVRMGLSGILVVRPKTYSPSAMTLYDAPASPVANPCQGAAAYSAFTTETPYQINEFSPHFNANPFTDNPSPYVPTAFLVNGQPFPNDDQLDTAPGDCVAIRYADLGSQEHSTNVVGKRQTLVANNSFQTTFPQDVAALYLNPSRVADVLVDLTGATPGGNVPVIDLAEHFNNGAGQPTNTVATANTGMKLGGSVLLLQVLGQAASPPTPQITFLGVNAASKAVSQTSTGTALTASARANARVNGATVNAAEWSIDTVQPAGVPTSSGTPTTPYGAATPWNGTTIAGVTTFSFSVPATNFTSLLNGDHTLWVRTRDTAGHWQDPPTGMVFTLNQVTPHAPLGAGLCSGDPPPGGGPVVCNLSTNPSVANGRTANNNVAGPLNASNVPTVSFDLVVDGTAKPSLPDYTITGFDLCLDQCTPSDFSVAGVAPTYNPGVVGPAGPNGAPSGTPVELVTSVPAANISTLAGDGTHTVQITAWEQQTVLCPAGQPAPCLAPGTSPRRGNPATTTFTFDSHGPQVLDPAGDPNSAPVVTPNPAGPLANINNNLNFLYSSEVSGTITDVLSSVGGAELFINCNPDSPSPNPSCLTGTGVQVTPSGGKWDVNAPGTTQSFYAFIPSAELNAYPEGPLPIYVHARDAAGNWGPATAVSPVLQVDKTPPVVLGEPTTPATIGNPAVAAPAEPAPTVTAGPGANQYSLSFWAIDPTSAGITSRVARVEWQVNAGEVGAQADNTYVVPAHGSEPVNVVIDISTYIGGVAQPQPAGTIVQWRVADGAGNVTAWNTAKVTP